MNRQDDQQSENKESSGHPSRRQNDGENEVAERIQQRKSIHFIDADEIEADFDFGEFCVLLDKESISFSPAGLRTILLDQEVYDTLPQSIKEHLVTLGKGKVEHGTVSIIGRRRIQSREEAKKRALNAVGNRPIYRGH